MPELELFIGTVPVATVVLLLIQVAKFAGLLRSERETRIAVLVLSLVGSGLWLAWVFSGDDYVFEAQMMIETVALGLVSALTSALAYTGLDKVLNKG